MTEFKPTQSGCMPGKHHFWHIERRSRKVHVLGKPLVGSQPERLELWQSNGNIVDERLKDI
jgi:hypothetical protein